MTLGIITSFDDKGFQQAKSLGLDFIEICYNVGNDCKEFYDNRDALKERAERYGVKVGSIGRWGSDKIDADGKIIEEELKNSYMLIDVCSELGCEVFNTGVNYVEKFSFFENVGFAIDFLGKLCEYGRKKGVDIATYNCDWNNFVREPKVWKLTHNHLKELGIKYDPSHCINSGSGDYLGEMVEWGDRFYHFHLKGTLNINGEHIDDPPAGLDMINWQAVMGMLYAKGYNRTLSIEPHSGTWRGDLGAWGVRYTVDYMSKLIYR
ncbi:MAG: sugar phosphate isomerase/epimerase [Clostridiales bacterium]|nr:sugar phosphate isomerase/epimerase [Clostridiales bacterium]